MIRLLKKQQPPCWSVMRFLQLPQLLIPAYWLFQLQWCLPLPSSCLSRNLLRSFYNASAEHGSSVSACCSTIQLMLCCPPRQAFPTTSLCRLYLLGIVRWVILLYVPHLLWEHHLCLVLMLPQVDLLLRMPGLPSSPSLLFGSSVPSI